MWNGQEQVPAAHPGQLGERPPGVAQVLEDFGADDEIERAVAEGRREEVTLDRAAPGLRTLKATRASARPSSPVTSLAGRASDSHAVTWPSPQPASRCGAARAA